MWAEMWSRSPEREEREEREDEEPWRFYRDVPLTCDGEGSPVGGTSANRTVPGVSESWSLLN